MIKIGSRYEREPVFYTLDGRSGLTRPTVMRGPSFNRGTAGSTSAVTWQEGVRLDRVTNRILGSPNQWWVLMDKNPDLLDPLSLAPGDMVIIS
jgi:hypothetical protein